MWLVEKINWANCCKANNYLFHLTQPRVGNPSQGQHCLFPNNIMAFSFLCLMFGFLQDFVPNRSFLDLKPNQDVECCLLLSGGKALFQVPLINSHPFPLVTFVRCILNRTLLPSISEELSNFPLGICQLLVSQSSRS